MLYPDRLVMEGGTNGRGATGVNGASRRTGTGVRPGSGQERELINYLERFRGEGRAAVEGTDLDHADELLRFARGQQWPENTPPGIVDFVLNLANDVIKRYVALTTDARPTMQVITANPQWEMQASALEKVIEACWQESSWQGEELPKGIAMAGIAGSNIGIMRWDPTADYGRGDVRPGFLDPRRVFYDPAVVRAHRLHEGEYIMSEHPRALAAMVAQYGERALLVKSEDALSQYLEPQSHRPPVGLWSAATDGAKRLMGRGQRRKSQEGGIERCLERHAYFWDFQRYADHEPSAGQPIYTQPRVIRHVVYAGDVVLVDEPNENWFNQFPHEILDWGMELEHAMGQSEVGQMRKAQEALNTLTSDVLRNAKMNNNFKVIYDWNALSPEDEAALDNRPMLKISKKVGSEVRFESPPSLPAYLFTLINWLVQAIQMVSGMADVLRGGSGGATSGLQLEGMQISAQTVVRLQARRIEDFIQRLWSKAIPMIMQRYTSDRVKRILGPGNEWTIFTFQRYAFITGMNNPREAFQDFGLKVLPGSSLATTRLQKAMLAMNLHRAGLIPGVEVLKQAEWGPDPEASVEAARAEMMQRAAVGGGQPPAGPEGLSGTVGGRRRPSQSFPASGVPVV